VLRDHLAEQLARTRRQESDLIFGNTRRARSRTRFSGERIEHGGRLVSSG
jgi:hypothetical protein